MGWKKGSGGKSGRKGHHRAQDYLEDDPEVAAEELRDQSATRNAAHDAHATSDGEEDNDQGGDSGPKLTVSDDHQIRSDIDLKFELYQRAVQVR